MVQSIGYKSSIFGWYSQLRMPQGQISEQRKLLISAQTVAQALSHVCNKKLRRRNEIDGSTSDAVSKASKNVLPHCC